MKTLTLYRAGWLIIGLAVLPSMPASAKTQDVSAPGERLEWLLVKHDVRHVIHASLVTSECPRSEAERAR